MKREFALLLAGGILELAGVSLLVFGFILQINLMGHGPVTAEQFWGVVFMFAGPALVALSGTGIALLSRTLVVRILFALTAFGAVAFVALLAASILANRAHERRGKRFLERHRVEVTEYGRMYAVAQDQYRAGIHAVNLVGQYEGRDGTILDGFVIGPPDEVTENDLRLSEGEILRFHWVRPVDPAPIREIQWTPPPPEFVEAFKDQPAYQDLIRPPAPPAPQPVRRFLMLISIHKKRCYLHSPYGVIPLPPVTKQPLAVVIPPEFRDQATPENLKLLR